MVEASRCSGSSRLAFDRQTGARPNPLLGAPGGYYVDSNQTLIYNGLQTSLRKRFSDRYSFDVNYTLGKGIATQGGDLAAYYLASVGNTQDFWDPEFDRGPSDNDIRHRANATFIYEVPGISGGQGLLNGVFGGWQISGILSAASGSALTITQPSGITASRPDVSARRKPGPRRLGRHLQCHRVQLSEPGPPSWRCRSVR